jgi:hypothetical protein
VERGGIAQDRSLPAIAAVEIGDEYLCLGRYAKEVKEGRREEN